MPSYRLQVSSFSRLLLSPTTLEPCTFSIHGRYSYSRRCNEWREIPTQRKPLQCAANHWREIQVRARTDPFRSSSIVPPSTNFCCRSIPSLVLLLPQVCVLTCNWSWYRYGDRKVRGRVYTPWEHGTFLLLFFIFCAWIMFVSEQSHWMQAENV